MGGKLLGGRRVMEEEAHQIVQEFLSPYNHLVMRHMLCGSIRRKKEDAGDIDLVITADKKNRMMLNIAIQKDYGAPWDHARKTILFEGVQLEVHICLPEYEGAMWLYATGSGGYNSGLRLTAAQMGLKLNRYGLWHGQERIAGKTEEEIYERLRERFVRPEDRR